MAAPGPSGTQDSLKLMGFEAYIETKDVSGLWKKNEVYKAEVVDDNKITGYIASTEDTEFRIYWRNPNYPRPSIASYYYADGRFIRGVASKSTDLPSTLYPCIGLQEDDYTMRPLQFAKLQLTDDDSVACKEEDVVKNAGSICIKMLRASFGQPSIGTYTSKAPASTVLSERSKKATISHTSTYGDAVKTVKATYLTTTLIDTQKDPYCTQFHYLSRDLLEARGIVPYAERATEAASSSSNTPEVVVKPEKTAPSSKKARKIIDIDDSDEESELEKLRRENAALRKKVKTEPGLRKTEPGTVIDLTDD